MLPPDPPENRQRIRPPRPDEQKPGKKSSEQIRAVVVGGWFTIVVAIISVGGTFLVNYLTNDAPPISCTEERGKAAELVTKYPGAWEDLGSDDDVQERCHVNEFVHKIEASAQTR